MPRISKSTSSSPSLFDPFGSVDYVTSHIGLAESLQRIKFINAIMDLDMRRMERELKRLEIINATGRAPSLLLLAQWWLVDHLLFLRDLIWGLISPILMLLLFGLFRLVVIIFMYVLFISAIYWMLTS